LLAVLPGRGRRQNKQSLEGKLAGKKPAIFMLIYVLLMK
jgi:hypothetical protein